MDFLTSDEEYAVTEEAEERGVMPDMCAVY